MISRRSILKGLIQAGAAGAAGLARPIQSAFATAAQPITPVNFSVPAGACDSHTCIIDPASFPLTPSRGYTPENASLAEMRSVHKALHIERVVIVQPSFYGTDNSCTLDTIKRLGPRARGVALLGDNVSTANLDEMQRGGICGIICAATAGGSEPEAIRRHFKDTAERTKGRPWHIEFHGKLAEIETIKEQILASPVPVLFDHFGGARPELGLSQPGFNTLLSLVRGGKAYVDVSAPYRVSKQAPDYPDVVPIARAIIAANPERVTWGTGWPHPAQIPGRPVSEITPLYQIDDGRNLNLLGSWTDGGARLKLALVDNPARLYGF